ncbi:CAP domain-containing protein [Sphaerimonospora cavernae]|uniref:CAP domain-containing protein n=1 Tax=Sphaerimonospora cavernae TaxID=1740611 RepID=A0ABV6UB51_9ACTN
MISRIQPAIVTGALLLGLTTAVSLAQPAAAVAPTLQGAGACAKIDMVYRPLSAFPDTARGRGDFGTQWIHIQNAVRCLVNAERTSRNLPPLKQYIGLRRAPALSAATSKHVEAAVSLRWWGKVEPGKNCYPITGNPGMCDPHTNPQTGSTPLSRAQAEGYGRGCASFSVAENTYVGWGHGYVTPRAAVTWWMNSAPHRANILNPAFTELYTEAALGSADPAAGSVTPAVTYVQMFGRCG